MISNFPTKAAYNPGGYASFKFIPLINVISFPAITNHVISTAISISGSWLQGYSTYETLSFKEDLVKSGHGESYSSVLSGFVPGESAELAQLLYAMEQMKWFIVQISNSKNKIRILGSIQNPLEFSSSFSSGDQRSDVKGSNFKFTGDMLYRAPFYQL